MALSPGDRPMVFAEEVLRCPCGGRRSVAAFVADATRARSLLVTLGRPAGPATFAPDRHCEARSIPGSP